MLLQIAQQDFRLTDDYVARKGTLIMPSITAATMQVIVLGTHAPVSECGAVRHHTAVSRCCN